MIHYLKNKYIKEVILILIAPEQSKLWKYWSLLKKVRPVYMIYPITGLRRNRVI